MTNFPNPATAAKAINYTPALAAPVEAGAKRWSRRFGSVVKMDRMKKEVIQTEEGCKQV